MASARAVGAVRRAALRPISIGCVFGMPRVSAATVGSPLLRATSASMIATRALVSEGSDRASRSSGLPRDGTDLPSDGGNRMSTVQYGAGMPSGQVIRVRTVDEGVAAATLRSAIERLQHDLKVGAPFPPEV